MNSGHNKKIEIKNNIEYDIQQECIFRSLSYKTVPYTGDRSEYRHDLLNSYLTSVFVCVVFVVIVGFAQNKQYCEQVRKSIPINYFNLHLHTTYENI